MDSYVIEVDTNGDPEGICAGLSWTMSYCNYHSTCQKVQARTCHRNLKTILLPFHPIDFVCLFNTSFFFSRISFSEPSACLSFYVLHLYEPLGRSRQHDSNYDSSISRTPLTSERRIYIIAMRSAESRSNTDSPLHSTLPTSVKNKYWLAVKIILYSGFGFGHLPHILLSSSSRELV